MKIINICLLIMFPANYDHMEKEEMNNISRFVDYSFLEMYIAELCWIFASPMNTNCLIAHCFHTLIPKHNCI